MPPFFISTRMNTGFFPTCGCQGVILKWRPGHPKTNSCVTYANGCLSDSIAKPVY